MPETLTRGRIDHFINILVDREFSAIAVTYLQFLIPVFFSCSTVLATSLSLFKSIII